MPGRDWPEAFASADCSLSVVTAHSYLRCWSSASRPVLLACDDGSDYVVKSSHAGRVIVNDHVVAQVGLLTGAPVGQPVVVQVPAELIAAQAEMAHMTPGPAHGTLLIRHCTEREGPAHLDGNRQRFASLAVLFGLMAAGDDQFIYQNSQPHLVFSVDHGHFFPGGPDWTEATLTGAPDPEVNQALHGHCNFGDDELAEAADPLSAVTDGAIAQIVGCIPPPWGVSLPESVALADYLADRRDKLRQQLVATGPGEQND